MNKPGFKLYTCDCGEIVIQFAPDIDPEVKQAMSLKGYDVIDPGIENYCCETCGVGHEIEAEEE